MGWPIGAALVGLLVWLIFKRWRSKQAVVGFFHPHTNDGGGGERVLWCAVRAMQELRPGLACAVYTGDEATPESLEERALHRFGVKLHCPPMVVKLRYRRVAEASSYPHFTLLLQSLGSIILGLEALCKLTPVLFFDTSGFAFTYFVARVFGSKVACYVHYPTVSTDMISRVATRSASYNNSSLIASSNSLSSVKIVYYNIVAWMYGLAGQWSNISMVNSSWTQSHIEQLWGASATIVRVYPPCSTESLQELPLARNEEDRYFISVGQFRPEKNHVLQLEAFAAALEKLRSQGVSSPPVLKLVGSCRNEEDTARVDSLKLKCRELQIQDHVQFCENVPFRTLVSLLGGAAAGIHSMVDEHFGICVVEYMAAGVIPIAHNSAGPKMDIVVDEHGEQTGFLASTAEEFAAAMVKVFLMSSDERIKMAAAARRRATRFSEARFYRGFKTAISPIAKVL